MAATIPTRIPDELAAGDTLKFTNAWSDYLPGDGWTLKYEFLNSDGSVDHTETAITDPNNADGFEVTVPASTTTGWTKGDVHFAGYVEKGTERYTLCRGTLKVLAKLDGAASLDDRSDVKKTLDLIDSLLIGKLTAGDVAGYSIGNRSLSKMSMSELREARSYYRGLYLAEVKRDRAKKGRKPRHLVLHRYARP